ncbi:flagellar basal-body MS-ring/collar protein FliF [Thiohalobacter sp. IOR34]|uniref:flagellar basal-body MS-ring/collar protein FliF n=1 Tax=Thiohalobacter sp. IOR34 TaxID=3057176 RepID=UPI0025B11C9B|nr:flagellar basal-body MS-ring/collar protein FliF [Thiohalobacter sp. IOR34]WJW74575.1 flagellar basal-body MS-ring/collar protein FliF [Thiohalobacter sp. IOR34]
MALVEAEAVHGFAALPAVRQVGLMIGLAASVALGVAVVLWSQTPNYSLLYANLPERDASQVADALQQAGIPYKIDAGSGALLVPADKIHEARLKLAANGLPKGNDGFEMLNGDQGFGTSQFVEMARHQHALEIELSQTIGTLRGIKHARVHLALPKRSVFLRKKETPTASVVVELYAGRSLNDGQVASIVNLVAGSVPHLSPNDVTVVDQSGNLLTSRSDSAVGVNSSQFAYTRKLEDTFVKRIEDLLGPLVGNGGVRAQVAAELDFTEVEKTQESYNPELSALRSEQVVEEHNGGNGMAMGVPGTLSNQPPGGGSTQPQDQGNGSEPPSPNGNSMRRSTRNYELDKTISHTRLASGTIRRLSIAVVLDDKRTLDDAGNPVSSKWSDEEIAKFTTLVKEAVGFDPERGDSVQIINQSFQPAPAPEPLPEPSLLEQPWVWRLAKQVLGGLGVLLLIFGVIKPVMRNLAEHGRLQQQSQAALATATVGEGGGMAEDQVTLGGPQPQDGLPSPGYEDKLGTAQEMVKDDPKRVAQLMKNWVSEDG